MRYVVARLEQEYRDLAYRIYVTDSLRGITGMDARFSDLIFGNKEEEKSGDEIAAEVIASLGLNIG